MLQVTGLDARDPLSVIHNLGPRLDQGVKDNIAVKIDDRNSSKSIAFFRQNALAVECQNLCLSTIIKSKGKQMLIFTDWGSKTYLPRLLP